MGCLIKTEFTLTYFRRILSSTTDRDIYFSTEELHNKLNLPIFVNFSFWSTFLSWVILPSKTVGRQTCSELPNSFFPFCVPIAWAFSPRFMTWVDLIPRSSVECFFSLVSGWQMLKFRSILSLASRERHRSSILLNSEEPMKIQLSRVYLRVRWHIPWNSSLIKTTTVTSNIPLLRTVSFSCVTEFANPA